jgi:protocatechuate 3,4-dioxygenase beta subunit
MSRPRRPFFLMRSLIALTLIGSVISLDAALSQQQTPIAPEILDRLRGAAPQTIPPPEPPQGEAAELTVRVVDAATGRGLPDVRLELLHSGSPTDRRRWVYSKNTNGLGEADFTNIVADLYTIATSAEGYVLAKGAPPNVSLAKGKKAPTIAYRMWRASLIEGTVQDLDGNPVPRVSVELLEDLWQGGLRTMTLSQRAVLTDEAGRFSFPAVLPGTYYLRAKPQAGIVQQQLQAAPADKREAFVATLYPGVMYIEQAAQLRIDAGGKLFGLRIEMQKGGYYSFNGRVSGVPPEQRGAGLVLIRRAAFDSPFPFTWASPYADAIGVQLAPDGSFNAPNVPPGPYWAGYTPAGPVRGGAQFLMVDRNIEGFQIEVTPGIRFEGKAAYEDGTPAASRSGSLSVFLPNMGVYVREFRTNANGEFATAGLHAGPYRLEVPGVVVRNVEINKRLFQGGEFELDPLGGPMAVTLGRTGGVIRGTVELHEQSREYARGMVTVSPLPLRPMDTPKRKYLEGSPAFLIDHLEEGRYRVCAWLEEGSEVDSVLGNPRFEQKFGVSCAAVDLAKDENRNLQLKQVSAQDFK